MFASEQIPSNPARFPRHWQSKLQCQTGIVEIEQLFRLLSRGPLPCLCEPYRLSPKLEQLGNRQLPEWHHKQGTQLACLMLHACLPNPRKSPSPQWTLALAKNVAEQLFLNHNACSHSHLTSLPHRPSAKIQVAKVADSVRCPAARVVPDGLCLLVTAGSPLHHRPHHATLSIPGRLPRARRCGTHLTSTACECHVQSLCILQGAFRWVRPVRQPA